MVSDSCGALMRRHKLKVSSLHYECKKERPSENMDLTGKPFEASDQQITEKWISNSHKETVERKDSENIKLLCPL